MATCDDRARTTIGHAFQSFDVGFGGGENEADAFSGNLIIDRGVRRLSHYRLVQRRRSKRMGGIIRGRINRRRTDDVRLKTRMGKAFRRAQATGVVL